MIRLERIKAILRYINKPVTAKQISIIIPEMPMALENIKFKEDFIATLYLFSFVSILVI